MWIFVMFWIIFVPAILLFWRLRFIWRPARANIGQAPAPTASSENQVTLENENPSPDQSNLNQEIEEIADSNDEEEEEQLIADPLQQRTSTGSNGIEEAHRSNNWYSWTYRKCNVMACFGGLLVGYVASVAGGGLLALPQYIVMISEDIYMNQAKSYGDDFCYYRNQWLLLHSSAISIMTMVGILISSVSIYWGRRRVLRIGTILLASGACCMMWFPNIYVEVSGLLLAGGGIGLIYHVVPIIYKEMIPKENRMIVFDWAIPLGGLLALAFNYIAAHFHKWGWRVMFGVTILPSVFLFYVSFIMLESPQYYIERRSIDVTENTIRIMRRLRVVVNVLRELLSPSNRPALVISTVETVFGSFSSVNLLIYYTPFILQSAKYDEHAIFLAPIVLSAVQAIAKAVGGLLIQRMGRRRTFIPAYLASIIPVVCLGFIFHYTPNKDHHLDPQHGAISVMLVAIHAIGIAVLTEPHGWLPSRFPDQCSEIGSTYMLCLSLFTTFLANNIFLHLLCLLREWIFFLFAGWIVCVMIFTTLFIPETNGIPQDELVRRVWCLHWFWKRYFPCVQEIELTRIAINILAL